MKVLLLLISLLPGWVWAQTASESSSREPLFVSFDGTRIHFDTLGRGRPVVLLHGFIANSTSWKRAVVRQALADAGFKVVTLDLRGNGLSDRPHAAEAYKDNAELRDVIGLMKHLGLTNYDVVGYSRGAILAAELLTLNAPVHRAILGGIGADFTNPNWARRRNFQEAFSKPGSHPDLRPAVENAKRAGADTVVMARLQEFQPAASPARLRKVTTPVLVINGDRDTDNGDAQKLIEMIPGSRLVLVPGDHSGAMRTPEFATAVVTFLNQY